MRGTATIIETNEGTVSSYNYFVIKCNYDYSVSYLMS